MSATHANQSHEDARDGGRTAILNPLASSSSKVDRRLLALAALACLPFALMTAPPAAAGWLPAVDLSMAGQDAAAAQVAVDRQGNAVAVWQRSDGANDVVQSAMRTAEGKWLAPVDVSAPGQDAVGAQVATGRNGNAVAVWTGSDGTNLIVQAAMRPAGGSWQAPVDISVPGQDAAGAQVAVDAQGNAIAVWARSNGAHSIVQGAARQGGRWQAPVDLSAGGQNATSPQVVVDPQGTATAVWQRSNGIKDVVQGTARPAGGVWQAPADLSDAIEDAAGTQVAVDAQGNAIAVWEHFDGNHLIVQSAARIAGVWQTPADVSAAGQDAQAPQVAVDLQGNAVAVWQRSNGIHDVVQGAVRPLGGPWQAGADLSAPGQDTFAPQVAVDAQGNAVAVWPRFNGVNDVIQGAARLAAGGGWTAPADLSAAGEDSQASQVVIDPQGNPLALWERSNGTDFIVQGLGVTSAAALANTSSTTRSTTGAGGSTGAGAGTGSRSMASPPSAGFAALAGLKLSPSVFGAARTGPIMKSTTTRTGTRVSYTLNGPATVRFTIQRVTRGRKVGGRCAKTSKSNSARKSCTRFVRVPGSFTRSRPAGDDRFSFSGRFSGRALKSGRYRLAATPTVNGRAGASARKRFRIVKSRRAGH